MCTLQIVLYMPFCVLGKKFKLANASVKGPTLCILPNWIGGILLRMEYRYFPIEIVSVQVEILFRLNIRCDYNMLIIMINSHKYQLLHNK